MDHQKFDLEAPLLEFSGGDFLSIKDSFEGIFIAGGIGSGKTTGSGKIVATNMMLKGYSFLVLCVKPEEVDLWRTYARKTNREKDLVIVEPGGAHCFDFLGYECKVAQRHKGVSLRHNIVSLLDTVINSGEAGSGGVEDGRFWASALRLTLSSVVSLSLLATGSVSVQELYNIALCVPSVEEGTKNQDKPSDDYYTRAMNAAEIRVKAKVNAHLSTLHSSFIEEKQQTNRLDAYIIQHVPEYRELKQVRQFFERSYKKLPPKTKSTIEFLLVDFLSSLLSDPFYSLFCSNPSTFTPESVLNEGKIVILNLPTKIHHDAGRLVQVAIKIIFQRAWEKRDIALNNRPAAIFADESSHFIHSLDADFQSTVRSSLVSVVYLTQNIHGYFSHLGGKSGEHKVKQFLGTLATKIFHANSDVDTNKYASELIGQELYEDQTNSINVGRDVAFGQSSGEKLRHAVRAEAFSTLLTGGHRNGGIIQAYIHRQGAPFGGKSHKKIRFKQTLH